MKLFKKIIILTILIIMVLIVNSYAETAIINIEAVRIRKEKNTNSTILTVVYEDDEVELIEKETEWSKIKYGEFTGYVKTEFLKLKNFKSEKETTENKITENSVTNNNVKNENIQSNTNTENTEVNLKENEIFISSDTEIKLLPSFISINIQEAKIGQKYEIISKLNNWVKITDGTVEGWILKNKTTTENIKVEPVNEIVSEQPITQNDNQNSSTDSNSEQEEPSRDGSIDSKKTGVVNVETAKIREKATTNSKNTEFLDYGDIVTIIGEENDFYKITSGEKEGYVSKKLITLEEKKTSSRSLVEERKEVKSNKGEIKESQNIENTSVVENSNYENNNTNVTEFAKKYLGYQYVLGGKTPETGFDCSGFTRYVYKNFGFNLSSTAVGQTSVGDEINKKEDLMPGDLLLFQNEEKTKIGHTGIYLGNDEFIHAANPERGVVIDNISTNSYYNERFVSARRIVK